MLGGRIMVRIPVSVAVGEWFNVKVDYEYTETGTNLTFTFTGDTDTTVKTVTTTDFNSVKKVGYGAGGNTIDLMYFDNFAITYAATAVDFKAKHSKALALTTDTVTLEDKAIVEAAIEAYNSTSAAIQTELADEYALLASLKVKIANRLFL